MSWVSAKWSKWLAWWAWWLDCWWVTGKRENEVKISVTGYSQFISWAQIEGAWVKKEEVGRRGVETLLKFQVLNLKFSTDVLFSNNGIRSIPTTIYIHFFLRFTSRQYKVKVIHGPQLSNSWFQIFFHKSNMLTFCSKSVWLSRIIIGTT